MAPAAPLPAGWMYRTPRKMYAEGPQRKGSFSALYALWVLTRHEFRSRYRAQSLGVVWSMLQPVVMMAILSVLFKSLFQDASNPNYPIFALVGLILWQFVSRALNMSVGAFLAQSEIVKRTVFPRQLLPLSIMLSWAINFAIESTLLLVFLPIFPNAFKLSPALLLVPVLVFFLIVLLAGVVLAMSVLNVIYRDIGYLVETGLVIFYWLTPVFYDIERLPIPGEVKFALKCSPLTGIFNGLRGAIMLGQAPSLLGWASIVLPTLLVLVVGWLVFRHYERAVLDYV